MAGSFRLCPHCRPQMRSRAAAGNVGSSPLSGESCPSRAFSRGYALRLMRSEKYANASGEKSRKCGTSLFEAMAHSTLSETAASERAGADTDFVAAS